MKDIGLDHGASDLAEPPIGQDEARSAEPAICRFHGGLIGQRLAAGDRYGKVYYCDAGRMFWRLTRRPSGMMTPLHFPKGL